MGREVINPLTEKQKKIVDEYVPFALKIASSYGKRFKGYQNEYYIKQQIISAALYGLVRAGTTYDKNYGIDFSTFSKQRIFGEIITSFQEKSNLTYMDLSDYEINEQQIKGLWYWDQQETSNDPLSEYTKMLDDKEKEICRRVFVLNQNQTTIAKSLSCSQTLVSRIYKRSLNTMRPFWRQR